MRPPAGCPAPAGPAQHPSMQRAHRLPGWLRPGLWLLLGASLLVAIAGCSTGVRIGYNQAESLVSWRLADYVDFEPHQRELFGERFRAVHAWHRRDQLPEYARLLAETRIRAADGLSREDVEWVLARSRSQLQALIDQVADDAAQLLASLTPAQVKGLERGFARANQRLARTWAVGQPVAAQRRARAEALIAQAERFTGRLTAEQRARVTALADALPDITDQRFAERQRRQRELIAALQAGKSHAEIAAWFRQWAGNWERGRDESYARLARAAAEQRIEIYVEIDRMLSPAQRRSALDRLQGYADDMATLSAPAAARRQQSASTRLQAAQ